MDCGRLGHAYHDIVVEIRLVHASIGDGDLTVHGAPRRERLNRSKGSGVLALCLGWK